MTLLDLVAALMLAAGAYVTAPHDIQKSLEFQAQPMQLLRTAATEYTSWILATAGHEYAHAELARHFTGAPSTIHLGTLDCSKRNTPWAAVGNIQLDGFNPKSGYTDYCCFDQRQLSALLRQYLVEQGASDSTPPEQLQQLIAPGLMTRLREQAQLTDDQRHQILIVGGLCGTLARLIMKGATEGDFSLDYIMVHELFNSLLPLAKGSDAYTIWQERFLFSDEQMDIIVHVATFLDISACVYCTVNDRRNAKHAPAYTTVMLGLMNYFLSGYLRFYAGCA